MKTARHYFGLLIAGILLFFLIKPFILTHAELKDVTLQVQWEWFISSFGLQLLYRSLYTYPFATLLSCITRKQVSFRTGFTLFHLANITRYLPGQIWGVVRLIALSPRFGLSKTAVGGSFTLHVGIETALGGLIAMSLIFSKQMQDSTLGVFEQVSGHTLLLTLAVVGIVVGVLFCVPKLAAYMKQFLKTLVPRLQNSQLWVNILAIHSLLWICQGLAFFLFVRGLVSVPWSHAGILTACYAFAWIVGFLSFLTPSGLGIREGLLALLLSSYTSVPQATLVALLCRIWMLSTEIVLAGVALFFNKNAKCLHLENPT